MSFKTNEAKLAWQRQHYAKNREKALAAYARYREANKEKIAARRKERRSEENRADRLRRQKKLSVQMFLLSPFLVPLIQKMLDQRAERKAENARMYRRKTGYSRERKREHRLRNLDIYKQKDSNKFQRDKDHLSDLYVKKQIAKHSKIPHALIPESLVALKRVQIQIHRELKGRKTK